MTFHTPARKTDNLDVQAMVFILLTAIALLILTLYLIGVAAEMRKHNYAHDALLARPAAAEAVIDKTAPRK